MQTNKQLWSYLAEFLRWDRFETHIVENIQTHFTFNNVFLRKLKKKKNCCRAGEATDDNMVHDGYPRLRLHTQNM